jgi:hypothetical protein
MGQINVQQVIAGAQGTDRQAEHQAESGPRTPVPDLYHLTHGIILSEVTF